MEKIRTQILEVVSKIWEKIKPYYEKARARWATMSKRQRTYTIIAVVLSTIILWAFITAGLITTNFNRNALRSGVDRQEMQVSSIILTETKDGQKFWEIFGETGKYSSDHKIANLNNVVGNFYKNNKVEMSFESTKGIYNEDTQEIVLYENVFVVLEDDTSIKADKLTFQIREKVLEIEGNVIINKKHQFRATAEKAVIDSDYSRFRIIGKTCSKVYD